MIQFSVVFQGPELCFPHRQVHRSTAHSLTAPISTCRDCRSLFLRASVSIASSQTRGILRSFGFPCSLWVLWEIFPRYTCLLGFPHSAVYHLLPPIAPAKVLTSVRSFLLPLSWKQTDPVKIFCSGRADSVGSFLSWR